MIVNARSAPIAAFLEAGYVGGEGGNSLSQFTVDNGLFALCGFPQLAVRGKVGRELR